MHVRPCGPKTAINSSPVTYNLYLQLSVDGLRGLANFNAENGVSIIFLGASLLQHV